MLSKMSLCELHRAELFQAGVADFIMIQYYLWELFFKIIKKLPNRCLIPIYHFGILGIGKMAEIKQCSFHSMFRYINKNHGVYLLE